MQSLLRWGIENSTKEDLEEAVKAPRQPLDPAIIDHILGKPDAVQMKESLEIAVDESKSEDERVAALDNLEMLIESLDNANDMTTLNMWTPLLSLLNSPSELIVVNTLWVLGTAVQNNPRAQGDFLARDPLPALFPALANSSSTEVRAKALYCISGAVKHCEPAVARLAQLDGWSALKHALQDANIQIRRKAAFLFNSLLLPSAPKSDPSSPHVLQLTSTATLTKAAIVKHDILTVLVDTIADTETDPDEDLAEKTIRVLLMFVQAGGAFESPLRERIAGVVTKRAGADVWGLTSGEWDELKRAVGA